MSTTFSFPDGEFACSHGRIEPKLPKKVRNKRAFENFMKLMAFNGKNQLADPVILPVSNYPTFVAGISIF